MIEKLEVCCLIGEVNFTQVAMLNWQCSDESISMQHEVDGPVNSVRGGGMMVNYIWER